MSTPYPGNYVSYSPNGTSSQEPSSPRNRGQRLGSMAHNVHSGGHVSPKNGSYDSAGGPVVPFHPDAARSIERQRSDSPTSSSLTSQSPLGRAQNGRTSSASSQLTRRPSPLDTSASRDSLLAQENTHLRNELEKKTVEREQALTARNNMLTDLITAQEELEEIRESALTKDQELASLRRQVQSLSSHAHSAYPESLRPGQREDANELRDIRLKCNRLVKEAERKDEALQKARDQMMAAKNEAEKLQEDLKEANQRAGGPASISRDLFEAQKAANEAHQHIHTLQKENSEYVKQLHDWNRAFNNLTAEHDELLAANNELTQAVKTAQTAQQAKSKVDDDEVQKLQAKHADQLKNLRKEKEFYESNSKQLSKTNKSITEQCRNLQQSLSAKQRELDQTKSMNKALEVQMK